MTKAIDFQEVQIKSVKEEGLFVFSCREARPNYWFIFFDKAKNTYWLIYSMDLISSVAYVNKTGGHIGQYTVPLSTKSKINEKYRQYIVNNFNKIP